ncbi:imidazole glycerol phosphate synthase subunit HisF [Sporomusa sp. KB1]|uniref:imidazole glycerol phosphate synthase subunit HisF n=1 Tax=Sporomusa sp. KB1 TaxID=943346 RepID=UPI0011A753B5|nr:imidazole glycerol phosphate synthase cyclase subunit [Sporomusa sp. KB1]TWH45287.1 cyclase [Sporomusa sp. KB1]
MKNIRLIARLDVKGSNLIKSIQLEGLRKLGNPNKFAKRYYDQGIDEIIYMDIVASLYERESIINIVRRTTQDVFIPITVGGGIRSIENVRDMLRAGADKISINTAAIKRPAIISEVSQRFGSQCMVLSIEAKKVAQGKWEAYYDNGREKTGVDVIEWAVKGYELGAGEILLTSVDREGTAKGFDVELVKAVTEAVPIPVIASGGMGNTDDFVKVVNQGCADSVAMAYVLHYNKLTVMDIRNEALAKNINVRRYE